MFHERHPGPKFPCASGEPTCEKDDGCCHGVTAFSPTPVHPSSGFRPDNVCDGPVDGGAGDDRRRWIEEVKETTPTGAVASTIEGLQESESGNLGLILFREETCSDSDNSVDPIVARPASHPPK